MKMVRVLGLVGLLSAIPVVAEDAYTWGNVAFGGGGFVAGLLASPTQSSLIYARTDVGGVYRWDSTGSRWIPLMDWVSQNDMGIMGTGSFALDPNDPAKLYILGGTSYFSNGKTVIMRSSDYGTTFDTTDVTSLFKEHGNGYGRQTGEKLAVDPQKGTVIYCGSRLNGLFKSTDGGKVWTKASNIGGGGNDLTNDIGISFVIVDPTSAKLADGSSGKLYVGLGQSTPATNLQVSVDGGSTFTPITGGPAGMIPMRAKLVAGNLYVTYSNNSGPHNVNGGAFYKYSIAGNTWTNLTPKDDKGVFFGSGGTSYAHGFCGFDIDPTNPNRMVLATLNFYGGNQSTDVTTWTGPWGDQMLFTTDGGTTWTTIFSGKSSIDPNGNGWIKGGSIHWMSSVIIDPFHPEKTWINSGNGIFRTDNNATAAQIWKFQVAGLDETVPLDLVSIPGGPLVTAIGDFDGAVYTDIGKSTPIHNPSIGSTTSLGYAALVGGLLRAGVVTDYSVSPALTENKMYYSFDQGKTWTKTATVMGVKGLLAMSADGKAFFHKPENTTTFQRSSDLGKTWAPVTGLGSQAQYAPIVPDQVNPARLYSLDAQGFFYASSDTGKTFTKVGSVEDQANSLFQNSGMVIRTLPGREGEIWVPLDQNQAWQPGGYSKNGLAYTTDGGKTFTRFSKVTTCTSIGFGKAIDANSYHTIFIWGSVENGPIGIYRSTDKGASWVRINDDKHQFGGPGNAGLIFGDYNVFGRVYMTSAGRGLIYGNVGALAGVRPNMVYASRQDVDMSLQGRQLLIQAKGMQNARLEIFGIQGNLLLRKPLLDGTQSVSLAALPKGFCVARIVSREGVMATKRLSLLVAQ